MKGVLIMRHEITHIRIKSNAISSTEKIYEVLLENGESRTIETVLALLGIGASYYYYNDRHEKIDVQAVHPIYKNAYIRSDNDLGIGDELLNLPHF
ncbi:hypothetical protein CBF35_14900 [Vagococcus salmoninarum]|uniref:DUF3892 domain-containing protein n=2 Tax=Vagococcus salmoninarum TaxID=2739 RepID=A0A429ZB64_9ENTE|nr:hypothetical protein CBF35_14900 [Vagococcus salmoninarum]